MRLPEKWTNLHGLLKVACIFTGLGVTDWGYAPIGYPKR